MIFDDTNCALGEGPLWHPLRQSLFWFDILNMRLYEKSAPNEAAKHWQFEEFVSAAGWIDERSLLIASETTIFKFELDTHKIEPLAPLEADNHATRSNDGRADPWGGFWIGTMGKNAEAAAGAIYRFYNGEVTQIYQNITISNSICFAPDGKTAYFCDTPTKQIQKVALDEEGWPKHSPEVFADVTPHSPDGSVVDSEGCLWSAQWGSGRIARYGVDGKFMDAVEFPASQMSCPAFGGEDLKTLFATSATVDLKSPKADVDGAVFSALSKIAGQGEHRVVLS